MVLAGLFWREPGQTLPLNSVERGSGTFTRDVTFQVPPTLITEQRVSRSAPPSRATPAPPYVARRTCQRLRARGFGSADAPDL